MLEVIKLLRLFILLFPLVQQFQAAVLWAESSTYMRAYEKYLGICAGLAVGTPNIEANITACMDRAEAMLDNNIDIRVSHARTLTVTPIDANTWELDGNVSFVFSNLFTYQRVLKIKKLFGFDAIGCKYAINELTGELEYNSCLPP